jgi:hypothetical protein
MNEKRAQLIVVCSVALICATSAVVQAAEGTPVATGKQTSEAGMLTRSQWLKRIGDAAKDATIAKEVMKQVVAGEKVEFTQRLLKAITRMPLSPEEKLASLIQASIACIGSTSLQNDERYKVIAEVIAVTPVEYLPGLVGALSKRFSLKLNNVTPEQFKIMAATTVKLAIERNKTTEDAAVRNTFAILLFLTATTPAETPDLQASLLASLPENQREMAKNWIDEALKGNFELILAAADAGSPVAVPEPQVQRVGSAQMERLLADIGGLTGSFGAATRMNIADSGGTGVGIFIPGDIGIQSVPRGYPNQGDSLKK